MKQFIRIRYGEVMRFYNKYCDRPIRNTEGPRHPLFIPLKMRISSFEGSWPGECPVHPHDLAEAGFFYEGRMTIYDDCVCCYYCGAGVAMWEEGDDPKLEHIKYSPHCPFAKSICK